MADSHATGSHNFRVCEHHLVCLGSTISAAASHAGTVPSWVVDAEVLLSLQQGPGMQGSDLIWFASAVPGRIDPKKSLCLKSWVPAGPGIDQAAQRRTHSEASLKYTERETIGQQKRLPLTHKMFAERSGNRWSSNSGPVSSRKSLDPMERALF